MKIMYIIHATYNSAGMERILINKANYFAEVLGYDVAIVTTDQKGRPSYYPISKKIQQIDIGVNYEEYYSYNIIIRILMFIIKQLRCKLKMRKIYNEVRPDCTILLVSRMLSFVYKISKNKPIIYEQHFSKDVRDRMFSHINSTRLSRYIYKFRSYVEIRNLKRYNKLVVLTNEDAKMWNELDNVEVIPNYIDSRLSKFNVSDYKNKTAIAVGRLDYQKGFDLLIEIWNGLDHKNNGWTLEIYGDGPEYNNLLNKINELDLNNAIHIYKPTSEIYKKMSNSSLFLLTSRFEGLPMVLLEAMKIGLPVISFNCKCGPSDVIIHGMDGYLIDEGDIDGFRIKLNYLLKDCNERKRMGLNAKANIEKFSESIIMDKWVKLFEKLH